MELTLLAAALPALLGVLLLGGAVGAFRRRRAVTGSVETLSGLLFISVAASLVLVAMGMRAYQAFTDEQTAATMFVERLGDRNYAVRMEYPDGSSDTYALQGDEVYVDARIIKWHPFANFLGIRTAYQLDRISGRYAAFQDEISQPRTLHELTEDGAVDLFGLVRRLPALSPFVDAEYGSAAFVPVRDGGVYQLRVSNSGLLIRSVD